MDAGSLAIDTAFREAVALIALIFFGHRYLHIGVADLGWRKPRIAEIGAAIILAIAVYVLQYALSKVLPRLDHYMIYRALFYGTAATRLAAIVVIGIFSPIVQEFVFRGVLLQGLAQRMHPATAIGVSAIIFGLVHAGSGITVVIDTSLFGIAVGSLYLYYRSLTGPIIMHIATNAGLSLLYLRAMHALG